MDIISQVLEHAIRNFPWQKSMRWGTGTLKWVRPLQSILCILSDDSGATVVPITAQGIAADNKTQGHRFMAPKMITVTGFDDYRVKLKRAYVILDPDERAQVICHDATNVAFASGLELIEDKNLLAEVSGLVEWPVVFNGGGLIARSLSCPQRCCRPACVNTRNFSLSGTPRQTR